MHGFPDLPPVWTLALGILAWVLARLLPVATFGWGIVPGVALILGGLALILWSALWFRRKRTTIHPHGEPAALIVEGPYRFNRNPIYTGMVAILIGWAFWLGAPAAFLPVFALPVILTARFIRHEEEALLTAFGPEAGRYLAATRRW
jgi:protein-S-isoprenylcysteine O-methyltransferase Ste14